MKRVTLTLREYTNNKGEKKKQRTNVGRVHQYDGGGEAIILDAALCATIAAMAQKALNNGEDAVWLSIFEDDGTERRFTVTRQQQGQQPQQVQYQQPVQQQQFQPPPMGQNQTDF